MIAKSPLILKTSFNNIVRLPSLTGRIPVAVEAQSWSPGLGGLDPATEAKGGLDLDALALGGLDPAAHG